MVDRLARTYGKWPHEVLELDTEQQNFAVLCMLTHDAHVAQTVKSAGMVFPTLDLASVL